MKQFIKLIVLMLIGLALNGCYSAQQEKAIEMCKRSCKYPLTFEVINTSSTSIHAKIDTIISGVCYGRITTYYGNLKLDTYESCKLRKGWDNLWKVDDYNVDYNTKIRIDSIRTYTIKKDCPGYTHFNVTFSAQNDFGVPCQNSHFFEIINGRVLDPYNPYDSDIDDFSNIDTISVNHFVNNFPKKIFKSRDEVEEYLNNFESNFKLKN